MLYAMLEFTGSCSQPCEPWRWRAHARILVLENLRHQLAVLAGRLDAVRPFLDL